MKYLDLVFALIEARRMAWLERKEERQDLLAIKEELTRVRRDQAQKPRKAADQVGY